MIGLGQRVFERRTRVTNGLPSDLLGTVYVPECHVVELIEHMGVDVVEPPDVDFGIAALGGFASCGDELMRDAHVAGARVEVDVGEGRFQCSGVILGDIGFGMVRANVRRFQEGDEPEGNGAEVVFEIDFLDGSVVDARKVILLTREQVLCVSDALGGVVIARSCQYSQVVFRAFGEEPIEKGGGLCGWRCLVV